MWKEGQSYMAQFHMDTGELNGFRGDTSKIESYLYKLNRQLEYMFNNLTPEDNYSEQARLTYVSDGERQASLEVALDGIKLSYVSKDNIISSINLSEEMAAIEAPKIKLEGLVTVNGYFKIGLDGSIEATNGAFSGDITASTITGSTFQLNRGTNVGFIADGTTFRLGDFIVNDWYDRQVLESTDEVTGMSGEPGEQGGYYLWAGWYGSDDTVTFCAKNDGSVRVNGAFYYNGQELESLIREIAEEYADSGDGGDDSGGGNTGGGDEPLPDGPVEP